MPKPTGVIRSIVFPVVVIAILGSAVNVAVTWRLASSSEWQPAGPAQGRAWATDQGYIKVFWFRRTGAEDVMIVSQENRPEPDLLASASTPPLWFPIDAHLQGRNGISPAEHVAHPPARARGWPLVSFWDEGSFAGDAAAQFDRPLPLRPIWPGLLINTVFYAGSFLVLWICARVIRRRMKKSRRNHASGKG